MNILIMGPAGAGKGTMSDLIIREYDIPHISTGDMLRENVRNNTELGQQAKAYMDAGKLVPDELINAMVEARLLEPDCQKGYLLDGFPRTLVQARAFEEMAERIGKPISAGSDAHTPGRIGWGYVELPDTVTNWREAVDAIMNGDITAVYSESRSFIQTLRYGFKSIGQWIGRGFRRT